MRMAVTFNVIPDEYRLATDDDLTSRIVAMKERLGDRLVLLTHHYQRREIVQLGDYAGDSYKLSKIASQQSADNIVFCGVHFMAESAEILAQQHQRVFLPNPLAGCPMADMAQIGNVMYAWESLNRTLPETRIIPLSYMNSAADLKAFCGRNDGAICTSSNAVRAFQWAFERGEKVFFFPDEHLGKNTANRLGLSDDDVAIWDFRDRKLGGNSSGDLRRAKAILWKGYCHVHTTFRTEHVKRMRQDHPGIKIVVHPECPEEVVNIADANGSTSFIVKYVDEAPPGSTIAIGTEINLIDRLARTYPEKNIYELSGNTCAMCVNMYRTTLNDLAWCLENIESAKPITVPDDVKREARLALQRMLEIQG
jgi:quinolinate synthase